MRNVKTALAFVLTILLVPSYVLAQESPASQYIEATNKAGESFVLKRDFEAEEQIQNESLAGCLAFHSSASGGYLTGYSSVVAFSYTTSCVGNHTASSVSKYPSSAFIQVALQKLSGGSWSTVASGLSGYFYSGTAGQYRIVVNNLGSVTATSWSFDYKLPL